MKKVYASDDRILIYHLKNTLDSASIDCFIKNDLIYALAGEVPVNEVWPELWITDDSQLTVVEALIQSALVSDTGNQSAWICQGCGERHEANFTACWKCGAGKPPSPLS